MEQVTNLLKTFPSEDVYLECDMIGQEEVLVGVAKTFLTRVSVKSQKWQELQLTTPSADLFFTTNPSETRFHVRR